MIWVVAAIAVCILMEALFSGAEIGFYSVNRLRARSRVQAGSRRAVVLLRLLNKPDATMMTTLIGTNLMVYAGSALATELLGGSQNPELLAALILTPLVFVFGEMIPKDIFHRRADSLMYALAGPMDALRCLLRPMTAALQWLVSLVTGGRLGGPRGSVFSRAALTEWIAEGRREGVLTHTQETLSANVLELMRKRVASVMIPIESVRTVRADLLEAELRMAVRSAGHSRLPVVSGPEMSIIGVLHTLDYICADGRAPLADLVRPVITVRQDDGVTSVLLALQQARRQMAIVMDAGGKPLGVATVKDLVEEIVGELQDF